MQGLSRKSSVAQCERAAWFLDQQISADESVADVGAEIVLENERLRGQIEAVDQAEKDALLALARRRRTDTQLQTAVRVVGYGLVGRLNGNRSASAYAVLFPKGYGNMARLVGARLIEAAVELEQLLQASSDETAQRVVASHGAELGSAITAAKEAEAAYVEAQAKEAEARSRLDQVRIEWVDAYFRAQRSFEAHFAGNRSLAEIYFLRYRRARKPAGSADVDPPPADSGSSDAESLSSVVASNGAEPEMEHMISTSR